MQKIIGLLLTMIITASATFAEPIHRTLSSLGVNKSAVSISIKDVKSGNTVYSLNDETPRLPASTLKLITSSAAEDALGKDFVFKTKLYKSTNNDLFLKLCADPLLSSKDLEKLLETAKGKNIVPKTFYIDGNIFDNVEWGEGWQWDDELNPLMPKFSAYNINNNLTKIEISPTTNGASAQVKVKPFYPLTFVNEVVTNSKLSNNFKIQKNDNIAPNMLSITGNVSKLAYITLPVANPKTNFKLRLEEAISKVKFEYYSDIKIGTLPDKNIYLADEVEHNLSQMMPLILKNSNNYIAETVFKTAGAVWAQDMGSIENSLKMLNEYLSNIGLNTDDIKIVDGSGVSKNNLISAKFMTDFLEYRSSLEDFEEFQSLLPTPGQGTLKNRMLYFKDNLHAKTGTLSDASAIAGYITSRRGKLYAFDIMINDPKTSDSDKKNIEEQVLREVYLNY